MDITSRLEDIRTIPEALTHYPQWVLWRYLPKPDDPTSLAKIPLQSNGEDYASSTNPQTWDTFARIVDALPVALERWQDTPYPEGGIGFVFTADDPFCGIDFDTCCDADGHPDDVTRARILALNSYTEYSPSGRGFHVICEATVPHGTNKDGIELYSTGRFFTMTGWHAGNTPTTIEPAQPQVNALWCHLHGPYVGDTVWMLDTERTIMNAAPYMITRIDYAGDGEPYACFQETATGWPLIRCEVAPPARSPVATPAMPDDEIIQRGLRSQDDGKFRDLYKGNWRPWYPVSDAKDSQSEPDLGFCCRLAFYTQDAAQIDRLFRASGLMRPKWDERHYATGQTYGAHTIHEALQRQTTHYTPPVPVPPSNGVAPPPTQTTNSPETTETPQPTPLGDVYNAEFLLARHQEEIRYCPTWHVWLEWTGTHWQRDSGDMSGGAALMSYARETLRVIGKYGADTGNKKLIKHFQTSMNHAPLSKMIRQAASMPEVIVEPDQLDQQAMLLNCANGTLDLHTGTLLAHTKEHYLTRCLSTSYEPRATCPEWQKFLWRIMDGHTDQARARRLIAFLQRVLGYTLTSSTQERCFFLLHGPTTTGKSTFVHVAKHLLGPYSKQADMETFIHKDRGEIRNDLARLAGVRLVSALESDKDKKIAMALMKQMAGGTDEITARFLHAEHFDFKPEFKIFLATNDPPRADPDDAAFWKRVKLIPFTVQIPDHEQDHDLDAKLLAELPGILAWCVQGCLAWQQEGLAEPPEVMGATQAYRDDNDGVQEFLTACCVVDPTNAQYQTEATTLYTAYKSYTGEASLSQNSFSRTLTSKGFGKHSGSHNKQYRTGIGLMSTQ